MNLNLLKSQYWFLFGMLFLIASCSEKSGAIEKEAKQKVEQQLKLAENKVKVLGQSSSGVDLNNENIDSLSRNVMKSLSLSAYEARKAYLVCEMCLEKKRKEMGLNGDDPGFEKHIQDSVYHAMLRQTVLQIDSITLNRTSDPTIQELLIEIEKLNTLTREFDQLCQ